MLRWALEPGGRLISGQALALLIGFGALVVAAFFLHLGNEKGNWLPVTAQIETLETRCRMNDLGRARWYRPDAGPVIIACDQVEQFRADNAHRRWSAARVHSAVVKVSGGVEAGRLVVGVRSDVGETPAVGDRFAMMQNPAAPGEVAYPDKGMTQTLIGFMVGGLGVFVLAVGFFWL